MDLKSTSKPNFPNPNKPKENPLQRKQTCSSGGCNEISVWRLDLMVGKVTVQGKNGNGGARQGWRQCMHVYISEAQSLPLILIFYDSLISLTFWLLVLCFFTITKTKRENMKELFFLLNKSVLSLFGSQRMNIPLLSWGFCFYFISNFLLLDC